MTTHLCNPMHRHNQNKSTTRVFPAKVTSRRSFEPLAHTRTRAHNSAVNINADFLIHNRHTPIKKHLCGLQIRTFIKQECAPERKCSHGVAAREAEVRLQQQSAAPSMLLLLFWLCDGSQRSARTAASPGFLRLPARS